MELNRAQLLVHNNAALNKFRTDHDIPEDVQIEHHRPNEDANLVEGNGDRIPIQTWLIHQAGLRILHQPNAKRGDGTLPSHLHAGLRQFRPSCACSGYFDVPDEAPFQCLRPRMSTLWCGQRGSRSIPFLKGNHYMRLRNPHHPQTRLVTDNPTKICSSTNLSRCLENGSSELGTMVTGRSQGTMVVCLSVNFNEIFKHRSDDCKAAIQSVNNRKASRKVTDLLAYEPIYRHVIPAQGRRSSSRIRLPALRTEGQAPHCGEFNSEGSGTELNEEAPVARVRGYEEGITSSFSSYTSSDSSDNKEEEEVISQLAGVEPSSMEAPLLNKRKGKQLAGGPSKKGKKKKGKTSSALLPSTSIQAKLWKPEFSTAELGKQDVVDLTEESSEEIRELLMMQQVQSHPRELLPFRNRMKQQSAELKKTKKKLGIHEDNPAWAKAAPEAELPESPESYSPMILPGFNEEEYMNQPAEEGGEVALADEVAERTGEAAAEEAGEDAAQDQAGEDAAQDPPPKL
ncbi:hypothetical protein Acr_00g0009740 [Actinidia rufa]|uniref:Uncharacterized protein n=1 Tax=Actinidia rufa TaxID=165716 RepID=A0A7J0D8Y8_9ERIC|nr:hypothetical protein Acr_00g0009740 [Actinidia rufa]